MRGSGRLILEGPFTFTGKTQTKAPDSDGMTEIPCEVEKSIPIAYRGEVIDEYRLDLLVEGKIVVEIKAVSEIHPRFEAQVLSYLKASGLKLGYLVNFGTDKLLMQRLVNPRV